jgi:hypothetical protein
MSTTAVQTGHIFAFLTGDRVKGEASVAELAALEGRPEEDVRAQWADDTDYDPESDTVRLEDPLEEGGWVDTRWSMRVFHDSRNDVRPVVDVDLSDRETLQDEISDAMQYLPGGPEDNGDGTFYSADSDQPYDDPWNYSYALHFVRKYLGSKGWVEEPWHPVKDGGFTL